MAADASTHLDNCPCNAARHTVVTRDIFELGYRLENPAEDAAVEDIVLMDPPRKWNPLEIEGLGVGSRLRDRKWVLMDGEGN